MSESQHEPIKNGKALTIVGFIISFGGFLASIYLMGYAIIAPSYQLLLFGGALLLMAFSFWLPWGIISRIDTQTRR
ncbi:MAG: hypothetical protein KF916_07165 [Microbacteriaceae bacterium]|nr:hypothetical protein [Microbacteriaceae bacterium]